jgi:hypothetical protein
VEIDKVTASQDDDSVGVFTKNTLHWKYHQPALKTVKTSIQMSIPSAVGAARCVPYDPKYVMG